MLKIRARSLRDGQIESDLVPTAGGIGPDGTVGISSPSREWIMGKSFDAGEGSGLEEERFFVDGSGEATAVGKVAGTPGTSGHRSSLRNTSHINSDHGDVRCLRANGSV